MTELQKALLKEMTAGRLFDFVSTEGYRFDKEELIQVIKELDYAIYQEQDWVMSRILEHTAEQLREWWA